jgi:hypothetical protein
MVELKPLVAGIARNDNTRLAALLARAHLAMIRGFPHIAVNPNSKVIFATAVGLVLFENNEAQILSEKSAPISLQLFEDRAAPRKKA